VYCVNLNAICKGGLCGAVTDIDLAELDSIGASAGQAGNGAAGAQSLGGGIYTAGGTLTVTNSTFAQTFANGGTGGAGGAAGSGGAGFAQGGQAGFSTKGGAGGVARGGGIDVGGGTVSLTGCTFE